MSVLSVNSLEHRLHIGLAISLVLLMGLLWLFGARSLERLTEDFIASRLEHDGEALLGATILNRPGLKVRPARLNQIYLQPYSGHYYLIRQAGGSEVTSRSLWDFKLQVPSMAVGKRQRLRLAGPEGQQLLVWVTGFRKQGQELTVAVAEDLTPIKKQRDLFLRDFALLALTGLIVLLVVQGMVVRRSFRRLEPLREDVKRLATGHEQLLSEDVPSEMSPLVREVNHLLQLLSKRNQRSRNALGNLAHALKAPLNLLTRFIDRRLAQLDDKEGQQASLQVERIRLLIERELKRARLAGSGTISQRFDAQQDLQDLLSVLKQIYKEKRLTFEAHVASDQKPFGDREDMLELLGNLLDNACKWADSRVRCRIAGSERFELTVEDDGRGLQDEDMARLTQRGGRLDESIEGHGLGLAIVYDAVKLYKGEIDFDRSPELQGLRVTVILNRL
ncbi:MAG: sensor histidine kinase [Candidatus Thiodiazotropha sp. (ex Dulcina madagascariensis)]|nr:sensor histidine kinase [Candidatus Thiodiazotropha sp. (ex Dulcina madagascariensis)]MCU7926293.1 sensor histidine kinase [Candidatus Thiodiazotropha sp. (ex Dulcina madagascariensis)]